MGNILKQTRDSEVEAEIAKYNAEKEQQRKRYEEIPSDSDFEQAKKYAKEGLYHDAYSNLQMLTFFHLLFLCSDKIDLYLSIYIRRFSLKCLVQNLCQFIEENDINLFWNPKFIHIKMRYAMYGIALERYTQNLSKYIDMYVIHCQNNPIRILSFVIDIDGISQYYGIGKLYLSILDKWLSENKDEIDKDVYVELYSCYLNNFCWFHRNHYDVDFLLDMINQALSYDATNTAFLDTLAFLQLRKGNLYDALKTLNTCVELKHTSYYLIRRLIVYVKMGKLSEAQADYLNASELYYGDGLENYVNGEGINYLETKIHEYEYLKY